MYTGLFTVYAGVRSAVVVPGAILESCGICTVDWNNDKVVGAHVCNITNSTGRVKI